MSASRPFWPVVVASCLAAAPVWMALAQESDDLRADDTPTAESASPVQPIPPQTPIAPTQDPNTRTRMTESVRRYGRSHQGGRVLGVDSIRLNNRSLNRVKTVDGRGRVRVHIDDPQRTPSQEQPLATPPETTPDEDGTMGQETETLKP